MLAIFLSPDISMYLRSCSRLSTKVGSMDGVGGLGSRDVELGAPLFSDSLPTEFTGADGGVVDAPCG